MGITKQMQLEEIDRNAKKEERLNETIARDDDVGFKELRKSTDYINEELIEVVENIQKRIQTNGNNP